MPKIALINVKYSPNLGDGIIAECLEREIARLSGDAQVGSIDLAGRTGFGSGLDKRRGTVLAVLGMLPARLRSMATGLAIRALIALRYRKTWRERLEGVDHAILGGGQLLADADLNFPLKINAALREVGRREIPLAVYGVGVAEELSRPARKLFTGAFGSTRLSYVAVRDQKSKANWSAHFGALGAMEPRLCSDPGLLCRDAFPFSRPSRGERPSVIGLGITAPRTLKLHSAGGTHLSGHEDAAVFWIALCKELRARGHEVVLFSNGPADDEALVDEIHAVTRDTGTRRAARPLVPGDLAETIAGLDGVVAHRLHSNIIAYSYRIPNVALRWDRKVEAFMAAVHRDRFVANATAGNASLAAVMIEEAMKLGVDPNWHRQVLEGARSSIGKCLEALTAGRIAAEEGPASELENAFGASPAAH